MQLNPRNSAAPAARESNRGEHLDTFSVPAITTWRTESGRETRAEVTSRRERLRANIEQTKASRRLNTYANDRQDDRGFVRHSERWERSWANWLVSDWGFDPEYVARRHGLTRRGVSA